MLSETAAEFGVDFVLGIRHLAGDPQELYARVRGILDNCPLIRGVQIEAGDEPVELYQVCVHGPARVRPPRNLWICGARKAGRSWRARPPNRGAPLSASGFEMEAPGPDFLRDQQPVLLDQRTAELRPLGPASPIVHAPSVSRGGSGVRLQRP